MNAPYNSIEYETEYEDDEYCDPKYIPETWGSLMSKAIKEIKKDDLIIHDYEIEV